MQTVALTVQEQSQALDPSELADFLYLFRAVNLALKDVVPAKALKEARMPTAGEEEEYRRRLTEYSPRELDSFFNPRIDRDFLQLVQITHRSPLEMVLGGCAFLLTLGVVFSGGKISMTLRGVKAELPSFGGGLKSLREALGLNKTLQAGFGIRGIVIKLSKEEYHALSQELRGQGGFQNLLHRLQHRINRQTRELELSPQDLERIYRYKADPRKGGFQGRFKKIFGRHFPDLLDENQNQLGF